MITYQEVYDQIKGHAKNADEAMAYMFMLYYSGHGLVGSGNWKLKDGEKPFSIEDVFNAIKDGGFN